MCGVKMASWGRRAGAGELGQLNRGPIFPCGIPSGCGLAWPGLAMLVLALLLAHASAQASRFGNVNETFCSTGDIQGKTTTNCIFAEESSVRIVAYGNGLEGCKFVVSNLDNPHRPCCYMESFRNFEEDPYLCDRSQQPSGCRAKEDASVTEIILGLGNTTCNLELKNIAKGDVGSYTAVFPKDEKTNKWVNLNMVPNEKTVNQTSLILAIVLPILLCIAATAALVWWKRNLIFYRESPVDPEGKQDEPSQQDQSMDVYKPKQEQKSFAQMMKDSSTRIGNFEGLTIYQPERVQTLKGDIEKYEFSLSDQLKDNEKTLLLIGAKGVGKSSFSNSLANYVFGVRSGDDFRFKIDDGQRVRKVTAYTLNESTLPYKLTIVDTPGLEGNSFKDQRTVRYIREFFKTHASPDAVCLFIKCTDTNLCLQKDVLNSVSQLLPSTIETKLTLVVTFCESSKQPFDEALNKTEIKFKSIVEVNNSAFFEPVCSDDQILVWDTGIRSLDAFFKSL